jgi:hypothetical protein
MYHIALVTYIREISHITYRLYPRCPPPIAYTPGAHQGARREPLTLYKPRTLNPTSQILNPGSHQGARREPASRHRGAGSHRPVHALWQGEPVGLFLGLFCCWGSLFAGSHAIHALWQGGVGEDRKDQRPQLGDRSRRVQVASRRAEGGECY